VQFSDTHRFQFGNAFRQHSWWAKCAIFSLGAVMLVSLVLAGLFKMGIVRVQEQKMPVNPVISETAQAQAILRSQFRILETGPWLLVETGPRIRRFERKVKYRLIAATDVRETLEVAELVDDNEAAQRDRYNLLTDAIKNGRAEIRPGLEDLGIDTIDLGINVASVKFLGDNNIALECELFGFHMPIMTGTCRWCSGSTYLMVQTDPLILRNIVEERSDIEKSLIENRGN